MEAFTAFFSQLPRPVMIGIFIVVVAALIYCLAQLVKGVAKNEKPPAKSAAAEINRKKERKQ